jgi:hypothetical protein
VCISPPTHTHAMRIICTHTNIQPPVCMEVSHAKYITPTEGGASRGRHGEPFYSMKRGMELSIIKGSSRKRIPSLFPSYGLRILGGRLLVCPQRHHCTERQLLETSAPQAVERGEGGKRERVTNI